MEDHLAEDQPATALSTLDHYAARPDTPHFEDMPLLQFTQQHTMPKELGSNPTPRRKSVVVIVRPYCSPDPNSPKYDQYCQQKLMLHVPFRHQEELLGDHDTYEAAYAMFLQSESVPSSLEEDIHRLLDQQAQQTAEDDSEVHMHVTTKIAVLTITVHT